MSEEDILMGWVGKVTDSPEERPSDERPMEKMGGKTWQESRDRRARCQVGRKPVEECREQVF